MVCVGPGRKPECWFSHDAAHICWSFGTIDFILNYSENRILPKWILMVVTSVARFITGHEQTLTYYTKSAVFFPFLCSLLLMGSYFFLSILD